MWVAVAAATIVHVEYGHSMDRQWIRDIYANRRIGARPVGSVVDVGGANPKPCFSDDLFREGDAIVDATSLSKFCFSEADREILTLLPVDLEDSQWDDVEAHVAKHGRFSFSVSRALESRGGPLKA